MQLDIEVLKVYDWNDTFVLFANGTSICKSRPKTRIENILAILDVNNAPQRDETG